MQSVTGCCYDLSMFPSLAPKMHCSSLNVTVIILIIVVGNIVVIREEKQRGESMADKEELKKGQKTKQEGNLRAEAEPMENSSCVRIQDSGRKVDGEQTRAVSL